jgi:hypothetical protein
VVDGLRFGLLVERVVELEGLLRHHRKHRRPTTTRAPVCQPSDCATKGETNKKPGADGLVRTTPPQRMTPLTRGRAVEEQCTATWIVVCASPAARFHEASVGFMSGVTWLSRYLVMPSTFSLQLWTTT